MRGAFTTRTTQKIWDREDGACCACGHVIRGDFSIQQRGDTAAVTSGLLMCGTATTGCRGRAEREPMWALSNGYRVTEYQDPALVPVNVHSVGRVLLTAAGGYSPVPAEVAS